MPRLTVNARREAKTHAQTHTHPHEHTHARTHAHSHERTPQTRAPDPTPRLPVGHTAIAMDKTKMKTPILIQVDASDVFRTDGGKTTTRLEANKDE